MNETEKCVAATKLRAILQDRYSEKALLAIQDWYLKEA